MTIKVLMTITVLIDFLVFFPDINATEFGGLFCEVGSLHGEYFGGCNVSALRIWYTKVAMCAIYHLIFPADLLGNSVMINFMCTTLAGYYYIRKFGRWC